MSSRLDLTKNLGYIGKVETVDLLRSQVYGLIERRRRDEDVRHLLPQLKGCRSAYLEGEVGQVEYRVDLIVEGSGDDFWETPLLVAFETNARDRVALKANCTRSMFRSHRRFRKYLELLAMMNDEPAAYLIHKANDKGNRLAEAYLECARLVGVTLISFSLLVETDGDNPEPGAVARRACWDLIDRSAIVLVDYLAEPPGFGMLQEWAVAAEKGKPWFAFTCPGEPLHPDMTLPGTAANRLECSRGELDIEAFMMSRVAPIVRQKSGVI